MVFLTLITLLLFLTLLLVDLKWLYWFDKDGSECKTIKNKVKQMISGNKNEERWITTRKKVSEITTLGFTPKNNTNETNSTPINPLVK